MKMYKKSDLTIIDGLLVCEETGDVVAADVTLVRQANELETLSQKAEYLAKQPEATPMPSLDGFERKSIKDKLIKGASFEATTPLLELEAAKAIAMMDEIDDVVVVDKANELLSKFDRLLEFVNSDHVIDTGLGIGVVKFDTPTLGNVLELTQRDITAAVARIVGLEGDDDCADCDDVDCCLHPTKVINADKLDDEDRETLFKFLSKLDEDFADSLKEDEEASDGE